MVRVDTVADVRMAVSTVFFMTEMEIEIVES